MRKLDERSVVMNRRHIAHVIGVGLCTLICVSALLLVNKGVLGDTCYSNMKCVDSAQCKDAPAVDTGTGLPEGCSGTPTSCTGTCTKVCSAAGALGVCSWTGNSSDECIQVRTEKCGKVRTGTCTSSGGTCTCTSLTSPNTTDCNMKGCNE